MAYRRSLEFLPSVFRTDVNDKLLTATMDQMISEPELKRLDGYIGRKFAPQYRLTDGYIEEESDLRQNYQLEPGTVYKDVREKIKFISTYQDLIDRLASQGAITDDHSRLFRAKQYVYDGLFDFDKFVNFANYYWLPNGPDPVEIFAVPIPIDLDIDVSQPSIYQVVDGTYESSNYDINGFGVSINPTIRIRNDGYRFSNTGNQPNPRLRLARGGTYTFRLDQIGHGFFLQTQPGLTLNEPWQNNLFVRDVYGVENNGAEVGTITFNVPLKDAQDFYISMEKVGSANLVAVSSKKNRLLRYTDVQYKSYDELIEIHGGLDGGRFIGDKTVVFLPDPAIDSNPQPWQPFTQFAEGDLVTYGIVVYRVLSTFVTGRTFSTSNLEVFDDFDNWYDPSPFDSDELAFDSTNYDRGDDVEQAARSGAFRINITTDGLIKLTPDFGVPNNKKIDILEGIAYGNRQIFNGLDGLELIRNITANLDFLYYQDSIDSNVGGVIELIDQDTSNTIYVDDAVIGATSYVSPNGVTFTNGLKIEFSGDIEPDTYSGKKYYVEGVGTGIRLVLESDLVTPETYLSSISTPFDTVGFDDGTLDQSVTGAVDKEYLLINRASRDGNAWSRINRWFHEDVLRDTGRYNNTIPSLDYVSRAKRPIIEFVPDLQLHDFGRTAKTPVTVMDLLTQDALSQVEGKAVSADNNGISSYLVDGVPLVPGMTVIFAADRDPDVKDKIWRVSWIKPQSDTDSRSTGIITDLSTTAYYLGFDVYDIINFTLLIDGVDSSDTSYQFTIQNNDTLVFTGAIPPPGTNVTALLRYETQIHLELVDNNVDEGETVVIMEGLALKGKQFYYTGTDWIAGQNKTQRNQPPLFHLVDVAEKSLIDSVTYPLSDFAGNKIFSYQEGSTGTTDPELGIKLKYRTVNNVGDILFSDFLTAGSFNYRSGSRTVQKQTAGCKIPMNLSGGKIEYRNQWQEKASDTGQYQLQTYVASDYRKNLFPLNVLPYSANGFIELDNMLISVNNVSLNQALYDIQIEGGQGYLLLDNDLNVGDKIDIRIKSVRNNADSIYEIPSNLELNPFNEELGSFTLGQMRSHIVSVFETAPGFSGDYIGKNNSRDLGDVKRYGGKIVQNIGQTHLANLLFNDSQTNFIASMEFAQREYARFKNKMLELLHSLPLIDPLDPVKSLDEVMQELVINKNQLFPYYYSDMIGFGEDYNKLTYVVRPADLLKFDITDIYDDANANDKAIAVYKNGQQLIKDREYRFLVDQPVIELITFDPTDYFNLSQLTVVASDVIEIREYRSTDGSYIPPTPTKLGLYPAYMPQIVTDGHDANPRQVLRGHDGSMTALFGDHRDYVLLEYELRVYNNLKVRHDTALFDVRDHVPGAFRQTEYSKQEFDQIMSTRFNAWLGKSGLGASDLSNFDSNDPYTWNYARTTSRIDDKIMPAGYWRGIYKHYFDTDAPHIRPWEMLGFSEQPNWWVYYYGQAPYTRGNKVLWDDIEAGRIVDGERQGIDERFKRPGLINIIPVNESGETLSPLECIVKDYNSLDISGLYKFGDSGPVETAWRQSSDYPFVLQMTMALMHPAEYFGANLDRNRQVAKAFGTNNTQWVYKDTGLRRLSNVLVHGERDPDTNDIYRSHGIWSYVTEYAVSLGLDRSSAVGDKLRNLSVQLAYKVGGYTDKKYLKIFADQASPGSTNASVTVPDEDFDIVINKSAPLMTISYSGIIVTKTAEGYSVNGYDDNSPYFTIEASSTSGRKEQIKVGSLTATKYLDGTGYLLDVPYGTEFLSVEQVVDFLISYGRYLTSKGFLFTDKLDEDAGFYKDWDLAAREFMFYVQQGWEQDVAISISPVGNKINFQSDLGVVDGLTNRITGSRALTEDFKILRSEEYQVNRKGRLFSLETTNNVGIYLLDIDVVAYEHVMVMNNLTRFSDVIFDPKIGARQYRLKLSGFKTGDWDGSFGAAGFIINDDNVDEWQQGKNYYKGEIVQFKNAYWTASENIPGSAEFDFKVWLKSDYATVKKGLLPNLANRAGLSKSFYDVDAVNLELDADRLGKGLIGLRPRDYFQDLQISDTSQAKFYQGMITQKGSKNSLDKLLRAKLDNFDGTVNYFEEWAVRTGQYGAYGNRELLQINLDETAVNRDPIVIEFLGDNDNPTDGRYGYKKNDIWLKSQPWNKDWLKTRSVDNLPSDLPSAGYALLDDVDYTAPTLSTMNEVISAEQAGGGDYIWIASNQNNLWDILRVAETGVTINKISVNRIGNATITLNGNHSLAVGDYFLLKTANNRPAYSGFYRVESVVSNTTITVATNFTSVPETNVTGQFFRLTSFRYDNSSEIPGTEPSSGWKTGDKLFIDNVTSQGWAVYEKKQSYTDSLTFFPFDPGSLSIEPDASPNGAYGSSLDVDNGGKFLLVGQPGDQRVYSYKFLEGSENLAADVRIEAAATGSSRFGDSVQVSSNGFGAISAPNSDGNIGLVFIVKTSEINGSFITEQVIPPYGLDAGGKFGSAIALSDDGSWLAVGQPEIDGGYVYLYQLRERISLPPFTQTFTGDGSTVSFLLTGLAASPEDVDSIEITLDGENYPYISLEDGSSINWTLSGGSVVFSVAPSNGIDIDITVFRGTPVQEFVGDGITDAFTLTGDNAGVSSPYQLKILISGILQVPFRDFTVAGDTITLFTPPANDETVTVYQRSYYELAEVFTASDNSNGDRFGASLDFTEDGRRLLVGAPNKTVSTRANAGKVYVYDRTAIYYSADGITTTFNADVLDNSSDPDIYNGTLPKVFVNGELAILETGYGIGEYELTTGDIAFIDAPPAGSQILIENNQFVETAILAATVPEAGANFGYSIKICPTNCSVYVGAPSEDVGSDKPDAGSVFRFVNQGRFYGSITGSVTAPTASVTAFLILNDSWVDITNGDDLDTVVAAINDAGIPGVTASGTGDVLSIYSDSIIALDKLKVTASNNTLLDDFGLNVYVQQQQLTSPNSDAYGMFGKVIAVMPSVSAAGKIAIGSDDLTSVIDTTFDIEKTTFDKRSTSFINTARYSGAVFTYEYIPRSDDTVTTPGVFILADELVTSDLNTGDKFGSAIAMNTNRIYVGAPGDDSFDGSSIVDSGTVKSFAQVTDATGWVRSREKTAKVDARLINRVSLIDTEKNTIVVDLDFVDPYKGKIAGVAGQELNFITSYDPAAYTNAGDVNRIQALPWGKEQVGQLWWDTSQTRWMEYEQGSIDFRAANWGTAFPNSTVLVYEWTESDVLPAQFSDANNRSAFVRDTNSYTAREYVDDQGNIQLRYYFWVGGKTAAPSGTTFRTLSTVSIENAIANPRAAGIPHAAFIAPNALALYNCKQYLKDRFVVLSIEYDVNYNEDNLHAEYQLLAQEDQTSLPDADIITKMLDSLAGSDTDGRIVPDVKLTSGRKYGKEFRPRQTMFRNRDDALRVAVEYINRVAKQAPMLIDKDTRALLASAPIPRSTGNYDSIVNDDTELGFLIKPQYSLGYKVLVRSDSAVGDRWTIYALDTNDGDVTRYWRLTNVQPYVNSNYIQIIDWIDPTVSDADTQNANYTVDFFYQINEIEPQVGQTARIRDDGRGYSSVLRYSQEGIWKYIKRQAGTFEIVSSIYDQASNTQGYDKQGFDLQLFDDWASLETNNILRAAYNDIFSVDHEIEKNRWFFIMINYLLNEQKYVDWIFKTSFIKLQQRQRAITQIPTYQKDNQDLVRQYIEETKPFHTKIREFVLKYDRLDPADVGSSDFDVPAYYIAESNRYRSPNGSETIDDFILDLDEYRPWRDNHKYVVGSITVVSGGSDYDIPPTLKITGGGGSGAEAVAAVVNGEIVSVTMLNQGSGYTSTPTITISGTAGSGAILAVRLTNQVIRKLNTTIKLDRVSGQSNSFLVHFLDANGDPVDVREERISRLISEAGVIDELLDELTPDSDSGSVSGGWIVNSATEIGYPVSAPVYRLFPDDSGRVQVFYRRPAGGVDFNDLQDTLRASTGGVNSLDISGTTVVVDGSLVDFESGVLEWSANTIFNTNDVVVHLGRAYRTKNRHTTTDNFSIDPVAVVITDDKTNSLDEFSTNYPSAPTFATNTDYVAGTYFRSTDGFNLYRAVVNFRSGNEFSLASLELMTGDDFNNHIDRLQAYYVAGSSGLGKEINQLLDGTSYPGVKVKAASFSADPGYDVSAFDAAGYDQFVIGPEGLKVLDPGVLDQIIVSEFDDLALGTRPEDINISGGGFVDRYSSHAPEEMIPGRAYDTLDMRVYTVPNNDWLDQGLGPDIALTVIDSSSVSNIYSFVPPLGQIDTLLVYTAFFSLLDEGTDYTINRQDATITINRTLIANDVIYVYAIDSGGNGLLSADTFLGDGVTKTFTIPVDRDIIQQTFVTIDGVKNTSYVLGPESYTPGTSTVTSTITFDTAPADGSTIYVHSFDLNSAGISSTQQAYNEVYTTTRTLTGNTYPTDYTIDLDRDIGYATPFAEKIIVELNGSRLQPPNQSYHTGDGSTVNFALPDTVYIDPDDIEGNEVKVSKNGVAMIDGVDWYLSASDGSTMQDVVFYAAPDNGDQLTISVLIESQYQIVDANTILLREGLPLAVDDVITIETFTNHDGMGIRTQVFEGLSNETVSLELGFDEGGFDGLVSFDGSTTTVVKNTIYDLHRPVTKNAYLWVTLDTEGNGTSRRLFSSRDFNMISPTELELSESILLGPDSRLIVTTFNEISQKPSIGFRIFQDMNGNISYTRLADKTATTLTQALSITDTEIYVEDASVLSKPNISTNNPGVIFIGPERVTYYERDTVNNKLTKIRRGTGGTVMSAHGIGTKVQSAGLNDEIPSAHARVWYNQGIGTATDGNGLQNSTTEQAKFLLAGPSRLEL